jgi:hypothetical protein
MFLVGPICNVNNQLANGHMRQTNRKYTKVKVSVLTPKQEFFFPNNNFLSRTIKKFHETRFSKKQQDMCALARRIKWVF